MTCTVDCIETYSGSPFINEPINGAIYTPYVEITFNGDQKITVGNESSPPNNHAIITSFQYGFSPNTTGYGADFEILDQGGTMYQQIIKAMNKTITKTEEEIRECKFDFGWIIRKTDDSIEYKTAKRLSGKERYGLITKVEQNDEGGKVKLKFRVESPVSRIPDVRKDDTEGSESEKVRLKTALRNLFTENHPKFSDVKFKSKDGGELMFKNSDGSSNGEGPLGAWPLNQQNPMAAARTWLSSITTENDEGIMICYDPDEVAIVFQESTSTKDCGSIGTYIVNGGDCSPVISFNPTITWQLGGIAGAGGTAGSAYGGSNDAYSEPTKDIQKAGGQTSPTVQQHELLWRTPEECAEKTSDANSAHIEANILYERMLPGFSAQLKIHGDPTLCDPMAFINSSVSIIVINPFHLNDEPTWVVSPSCHPYLSNKRYFIRGIEHQISNGSFVTTLEVMLLQPNVELPADESLGACGTDSFKDGTGSSEATDANE